MNTNDIITFFFEKCVNIVQEMKRTNHHYDESNGILNPYHMEGEVLTHTLMVVQQAEVQNMSFEIALGCLFHDFGKFDCREENHENQRVSFIGHEAYSAFKSIKYMKMLGLNEETIIRLFKLISLHTLIYHCNNDELIKFAQKFKKDIQLLNDLKDLGICDGLGRFTVDEISPKQASVETLKANYSKIIEIINQDNFKKEKEKKLEVIVFSGLPLSGKSTMINNLIKTEKYKDYCVISRDNIILKLGNGKNYTESYASVDFELVESLLIEEIRTAIANKKNVIFDLTALTKKSRRRLLGQFNNNYKKISKVIIADLDTIYERNKLRGENDGKLIELFVIERMIKSFVPPLFDEFEEIEYYVD